MHNVNPNAVMEVKQAFDYLDNSLYSDIKHVACSFQTFHRLTLDRYVSEEWERFESCYGEDFVSEFFSVAEERYNTLVEVYEDLKQEYYEELGVDDMPDYREIFDIALSMI